MSSRLFSGRTETAAEIEPNTLGPYHEIPRVSRMPLKLSNPFRVGSGTRWVSNREYMLKTPYTVKITAKVVRII